MADSNIGALPQAAGMDDDSLLVMEQQGAAMKLTGAQLREYAKQGVALEFQNDLEQSQAAADRAQSAAGAVMDMTVDAHALETGLPASAEKSVRDGKVHLSFGIPRGEQGIPGPRGEDGPRGPQGAPGNGLTILGHYEAEDALRAAVPSPNIGDAYSVGAEAPYDTYVFDGVTLDWRNYGPLSGGGGGILPENVVTVQGGAEINAPDAAEGVSNTLEITFDEEDSPLSADDIAFDKTKTGLEADSVQAAVDLLFTSVSDGKRLVASAITDKGVPTAQDAAFSALAENIGKISGGEDTSDATAEPWDILSPKTAYTAAGKVTGLMPSLGAQTITPGTGDKTIANGQYLSGTQTIKGDANLVSANIRKGVRIFEVDGAMESSFQATLTVTADIGAVVTATHTDGTEVSALSTTGAVALELPVEGDWVVTAVRGVAQYNSVVVTVTSQYSAALTAEVHIQYYGSLSRLTDNAYSLSATSNGKYAIFAGGYASTSLSSYLTSGMTAYDNNLVKQTEKTLRLNASKIYVGATSVGEYAIFAGGDTKQQPSPYSDVVQAYDSTLTYVVPESLSSASPITASASIGNYALFAGYNYIIDAYSASLVHTVPIVLNSSASLAAANANYAVFGGSAVANGMTAYNSSLSRSMPPALSKVQYCAAQAGNYVLFVGSSETAEAYDLFLTKTEVQGLSVSRTRAAGTTLNGFAVFAGGIGSVHMRDVDAFDPYLTRTTPQMLSSGRHDLAAASIGKYALFGGGYTGSANSGTNTVDAYQYV